MLYIPKIGDIVKVNKMIGDDPKLLQNNQEVENIIKVDTTDVETYQVDLVGSGYLFTNHDLILISRSNNLLSVSNDSITEAVLSEPEMNDKELEVQEGYCILLKDKKWNLKNNKGWYMDFIDFLKEYKDENLFLFLCLIIIVILISIS